MAMALPRSHTRPPSGVDSSQGRGPPTSSAVAAPASSPPSLSAPAPPPAPPSPAVLLSSFVSAALSSLLSTGDRRAYDTLLSQLSSSVRSGDSAACGRWLAALASSSARLSLSSPQLTGLVSLLLAIPLPSMSLSSLRLYTDLLIDLSTHSPIAQNTAVRTAYAQLCTAFDPPQLRPALPPSVDASAQAAPAEAVDTPASAEEVQRTVHAAIGNAPVLGGVLVDRFPSSRQSTDAWLLYVSSALRVAEYAPAVRERLLTCTLERLTQLDVDLAAQQQQLQLTPAPATKEEVEEEEEEVESSSSPPLVTLVDRRLLSSADVRRLDAVLCLLLSYLQRLSTSSATSPFLCDDVFAALLRVFSASILPTVGVRVVQWVLFYHCSLRHSYAEAFLRWLLERTFDQEANLSLRLSCVDYTQSFIARAAFIRHPSAMIAFNHVLQWTTAYAQHFIRQAQDTRSHASPFSSSPFPSALPLVGPVESAEHALFYRCFQCLLYVFVYRWRAFDEEMEANAAAELELYRNGDGDGGGPHHDLSGDDDEGDERRHRRRCEEVDVEAAQAELLDGRLTRPHLRCLLHLLVSSPLDPLRYSTPFIVREFSRLAQGMDLLDLRPALRRQRWRRAEEAKEAAAREGASAAGDSSAAALSRLLLSSHSALNEGSGLLGHRSAAYAAAPPSLRPSEQPSALSAAFPFDPYFLPASANILLPLYNHYQPPPALPSSPPQRRRAPSLPHPILPLPRSAIAREKRKVEQSAPHHLDADMDASEANAGSDGEGQNRRGGRERRQRLSVDWMEEAKEARHRLGTQSQVSVQERSRRQEEKHQRSKQQREEEGEEEKEEEGEEDATQDEADADEASEGDGEGESGELRVVAPAGSVPTFSPGFGPSLSTSPLAPSTSPSVATSSAARLSHFLSPSLGTVRQPLPSSSPLSPSTAPLLSLLPPSARSSPPRMPERLAGLHRPTPSKGRSLATFTQRP